MNAKQRRNLFNLAGTGILLLWLVMMGLQIKKVSFPDRGSVPSGSGSLQAAVPTAQREWMEIFLRDRKVGYSLNQVNPIGEGYLVHEEIFMRLNLTGHAGTIHTVSRSVVDDEFFLKSFRFRMTSGAVSYGVSGSVEGDHIVIERGEGRSRKGTAFRLKAGRSWVPEWADPLRAALFTWDRHSDTRFSIPPQ